uniref:Uncharacterized protein n=1 Tax=Strongyloides papillosus TaxID=174720 RepID=A0A0N5BUQ6_STREA
MKNIVLVSAFLFFISFLLTESFEFKKSLISNNENNDNSLLPAILNDDEDINFINKRSKIKSSKSNNDIISKSKTKDKKRKKNQQRSRESFESKTLKYIAKAISDFTNRLFNFAVDVKIKLDRLPTVCPSGTTKPTPTKTKRPGQRPQKTTRNRHKPKNSNNSKRPNKQKITTQIKKTV